ncbi:MAG: DUF1499 domain-containing protein [Pseudomonadota bacterium]
MKIAVGVVLVIVVAAIAVLVAIRTLPSDPDEWHVDPLAAEDPGEAGVLLVPPEAPVFTVSPEALAEAFDTVAMAAPRTKRLAGSPDDGFTTYIVRSKWMGFPDYVSVRTLPADGGSTLAVFSRLRFGGSDLGVNTARLEAWLAALKEAVPEAAPQAPQTETTQ